jgi:hypothetical protein
MTETGSRLYYISTEHGDDATAEIYFWNGTNIIDASGSTLGSDGQPYGTDPMNPSGKIKEYKNWFYVAPRRTP